MKKKVLYHVGQFAIWGDFYLVLFFLHSLFVSPISVEAYFSQYFLVALYLFEWLQSWHGFLDLYLDWVLRWPASFLFFLRFAISTSIGVYVVRRFS